MLENYIPAHGKIFFCSLHSRTHIKMYISFVWILTPTTGRIFKNQKEATCNRFLHTQGFNQFCIIFLQNFTTFICFFFSLFINLINILLNVCLSGEPLSWILGGAIFRYDIKERMILLCSEDDLNKKLIGNTSTILTKRLSEVWIIPFFTCFNGI